MVRFVTFLALVSAAASLSATSRPVTAQEIARVTGTPVDGMAIVVDTVLKLGQGNEGVGPTMDSMVRYNDHFGFVVSPTWVKGKMGIWNSQGDFRAAFGNRGKGPGEFETVVDFWFDDFDTLNIVVPSPPRRDLYFQGKYVRSSPWHGSYSTDVVPLSNGGYVQGGFTRHHEMYGSPAHQFDSSGQYIKSLGRRTGFGSRGWPSLVRLGRGSEDHLWMMQSDRYEIERISLKDFSTTLILDRQVDWFPDPRGPAPSRSPGDDPSAPLVYWVNEDSDGLLWIGIRVAAPGGEWDQPRTTLEEMGEAFDFIIEVIDPEKSTVVASRRLDDVVPLSWVDRQRAFDLVEDPATGLITVHILTLSIERPRP